MRLAVTYADHRPDRMVELFPDDHDTVMHLHVVFAEASTAFATGGPPPVDGTASCNTPAGTKL